MSYYIQLLKYYMPRNYFLRIFQFLFWFLSYYYDEKPTMAKLSVAISDSRAIMNLFSIFEKVYQIFAKSVFFKNNNKIEKLTYLTYITSFCHIFIHSICFILGLCGNNLNFLERIYNTFYTFTVMINLMIYKIELEELYNIKPKELNKETKEKKKMINIGVIIIGFNMPLALNGTGLINKIIGFKLNKPVEGFLGVFASIMQFYVASTKHLKEIKSNYIDKNIKDKLV